MVITKREDVTKQEGSCKLPWRKLRLRGSLLLVIIHVFFFWGGGGAVGAGRGGEGGRLFEFECDGEGGGVKPGAY